MEQHSFANTILPIISAFYTTLTICVVESVVGVWEGGNQRWEVQRFSLHKEVPLDVNLMCEGTGSPGRTSTWKGLIE